MNKEAVSTDSKDEVRSKKNEQNVGSHKKREFTDFSWYITGFVDGEGCFSVSFNLRSRFTTGIEVRPSFAVGQNKRSLQTLLEIQKYFGCGGVRFNNGDQTYKYEVRKTGDLITKIIPHFEKFPLKTSKSSDFEKFKRVVELIYQSKHLNKKYLTEIIHLSYQMNISGKRKYTEEELLKILVRWRYSQIFGENQS